MRVRRRLTHPSFRGRGDSAARLLAALASVIAWALFFAGPASAAAPVGMSLPVVSGSFVNGQALTSSQGDWLGSAPISYAYQWQRCSSYKDTVLADSPVGYWRLGEAAGATSAADASASGNGGSYLNGPTLGRAGALSGDGDFGVLLDGAGALVDVPDAASLKPSAAFSLEAWLKTTRSSGVVIAKPYSAGSQLSYALRLSAGKAKVQADLSGGSYSAISTGSVNDGQWHHLVGTFDGADLRIYVDGSLQATTATSGSLQYSTLSLQLGRFDASGADYLNGTIDEIAVYGSALSATRIQAHSDAGSLPAGPATCNAISGATGSFYVLGSADVGSRVRVTVTASNTDGSASATSYATVALPASPRNLTQPAISGTASAGQTLASDTGGWTGAATITYAYQWQRCNGYAQTVSSDGPVGWWRLGELSGTTAADAAGAIAGTYQASPLLGIVGPLGSDVNSAVNLNGTSQYVRVDQGVQFDASNFTVEGWFKASANPAYDVLWDSGYLYGAGSHRVSVYFTGTGRLTAYVTDGVSGVSATGTSTYQRRRLALLRVRPLRLELSALRRRQPGCLWERFARRRR